MDKFINELRNLVYEVAEYALETDDGFINEKEYNKWYSKIDKMIDSKAKKLFNLAKKSKSI